jgi:hypothetical protein
MSRRDLDMAISSAFEVMDAGHAQVAELAGWGGFGKLPVRASAPPTNQSQAHLLDAVDCSNKASVYGIYRFIPISWASCSDNKLRTPVPLRWRNASI